ncbi:MAG: hypothetical protein ACI8RZ_000823 [Myxococcota bacterium]|jgi:hypothetical protein
MTITAQDLHRAILTVIGEPSRIQGSQGWVEFREPPTERDGGLLVCLWLVVTEEDGSICTIKEQVVYFLDAIGDPARLEPMLEGWASTLAEGLTNSTKFEDLMPMDVCFPKILSLKRPKTIEDFAARFAVRSRLGKLLSE